MTKEKYLIIELWNSKNGWRIRIKSRNGKILLDSEAYSSKRKAAHTALLIAECLKYKHKGF